MRERRRRSPAKVRAELVLVVVCVGIISAGPLAQEGVKSLWGKVFIAAFIAMALYLKGRLEPELDQPPQPTQDVLVVNKPDHPVPTVEEPHAGMDRSTEPESQ